LTSPKPKNIFRCFLSSILLCNAFLHEQSTKCRDAMAASPWTKTCIEPESASGERLSCPQSPWISAQVTRETDLAISVWGKCNNYKYH
jgi:hypothetical protein